MTLTPGQLAVLAAQAAAATNIRDALQALIDADAPPPPTYTLTADRESVEEGQSVLFRLQTTGLQTGAKVRYDLVGSIVAADVLVPVDGVLSIGQDGSAVLMVPIAADRVTEGTEVLTCSIEAGLASASVKVIDTSTAPPPPLPPPPPAGDMVGTGHDYKPPGDPNHTAWLPDQLRAGRIPPLHRPWRVYADEAKGIIGRHAQGVPPARFMRLQPFGGIQGYAEYLTTLHEGGYLSFLPSASDKPDEAAGSLRAGWTQPRPGVRKPLFIRPGRRGEAIGSPYITWHGHSRLDEHGQPVYGDHIPLFVGVDVIGRFWSLHPTGELKHLGDVPVTTWSNDFSYYREQRKVMFVTDTGAGRVLKVDRRTTPWTTTVLAELGGHITSVREVGGLVYACDNISGNVYEISPDDGARRLLRNVSRAFWLDYDSAGHLLVCTDTRRVYRIDRQTGQQIGEQIIPPDRVSGVVQPWITLECDRSGALGVVDALYIASVQATNGTHVVLRIGGRGETLGPWFGWPSGAGNNSQGWRSHCGDPDGHYPWTAAILGQDGGPDAGLLTMGKAEANPTLTIPLAADHPWRPMREEINGATGRGRLVVYEGTSPGAADARKVPSFTTQMNLRGQGLIDADFIAAMPLAEAARFVREGMGSTTPRPNISANDLRSFLVMCHANSQQYLIDGAPYMERIWREVLALHL